MGLENITMTALIHLIFMGGKNHQLNRPRGDNHSSQGVRFSLSAAKDVKPWREPRERRPTEKTRTGKRRPDRAERPVNATTDCGSRLLHGSGRITVGNSMRGPAHGERGLTSATERPVGPYQVGKSGEKKIIINTDRTRGEQNAKRKTQKK